MTNILIEGGHIPTYDMTIKVFERFSKSLPIKVRSIQTRYISRRDIIWCDIFICVRGSNPLSLYLCQQAKRQDCKVILLLDDDLLSYISQEHPFYERILKKSLLSIIKLCDIILTPSVYLGEKYGKQYEKRYIVIDTAIDCEDIKSNWLKSNKVRLLYAAGHMYNFQKLIAPVLDKLYDKYGDSISVTVMGGKIDTESILMPIIQIDSMPYKQYRDFMQSHSFDIGVAPLIETEMTKSKYFNKYLEYSTQGICGIYSNNLPYTYVIKDNHNGLLAENTTESWYNCICKLIDDPFLRQRCVANAQLELTSKFSNECIMEHLCIDIPWITTYEKKKGKGIFFKIPSYPLFLLIEFIRRTLKYLYPHNNQ